VKTGYVPTTDMVQEVTVSQNTVDAEFGHGSGSAISVVTKGGTNQFHGSAYYYGRYPWASAISNRQFRTVNLDRQQMYGGNRGSPHPEEQLFNFVSFEGWQWNQAASPYIATLPTDLERQGNFSQSINATGGLNTIYDPYSTKTAADGSVTRTPIPGNIIPGSQQDPVAVKYMGALWKPNGPGRGTTIFRTTTPWPYRRSIQYRNYADRVDYHVNDKLNVTAVRNSSGHRSAFRIQPVRRSSVSDRGSQRDGDTYSGSATYALNATTVLSVSGDYHKFVDASRYGPQPEAWDFCLGLSELQFL